MSDFRHQKQLLVLHPKDYSSNTPVKDRQGSGLPCVCASACLDSHSLLKLVMLELAPTAAKSSHPDVDTLSPLVCDWQNLSHIFGLICELRDLGPFELVCFWARIMSLEAKKLPEPLGSREPRCRCRLMFKAPASYSRAALWDCYWDANSKERPERGTRTDTDRVGTYLHRDPSVMTVTQVAIWSGETSQQMGNWHWHCITTLAVYYSTRFQTLFWAE